VREAAKLARWPNNGLRHSFASYRLAAVHDAPRVAHELGHTSPQMLYSTYREPVLPTEAERYWTILPAEETANVVAFSASVSIASCVAEQRISCTSNAASPLGHDIETET
jgi:hypothetical protein